MAGGRGAKGCPVDEISSRFLVALGCIQRGRGNGEGKELDCGEGANRGVVNLSGLHVDGQREKEEIFIVTRVEIGICFRPDWGGPCRRCDR